MGGIATPGFFGRYTKVNRLLTEGRRAFLRRVSGIQRGAECARYEPLLSALADDEASADDVAKLRPHMQTCLSCRAALREFRAMPERVASVVPPAPLVVADGGGPLRSLIESAIGASQHKTAAMGDRLQAAAELATGQKAAAVAASAALDRAGVRVLDLDAAHGWLDRHGVDWAVLRPDRFVFSCGAGPWTGEAVTALRRLRPLPRGV